MITLKNAFAAGLALLALPALAQTYAQAEDRPGRYVLVPISVQRPAGDGWMVGTGKLRWEGWREPSIARACPRHGDAGTGATDAWRPPEDTRDW